MLDLPTDTQTVLHTVIKITPEQQQEYRYGYVRNHNHDTKHSFIYSPSAYVLSLSKLQRTQSLSLRTRHSAGNTLDGTPVHHWTLSVCVLGINGNSTWETTVYRICSISNMLIPADFPYFHFRLKKSSAGSLIPVKTPEEQLNCDSLKVLMDRSAK